MSKLEQGQEDKIRKNVLMGEILLLVFIAIYSGVSYWLGFFSSLVFQFILCAAVIIIQALELFGLPYLLGQLDDLSWDEDKRNAYLKMLAFGVIGVASLIVFILAAPHTKDETSVSTWSLLIFIVSYRAKHTQRRKFLGLDKEENSIDVDDKKDEE